MIERIVGSFNDNYHSLQLYLDAAEQDKERYIKEFNDYKQTDAYTAFLEKQKEREKKKSTAKQKESKESKKEKNGTDTPNSTIVHKVKLIIIREL